MKFYKKAKALVSHRSFKDESYVTDIIRLLSDDLGGSIKYGVDVIPEKGVTPTLDPNSYRCVDTFRSDYLLCELLSKYPFRIPGVDRKAVALEKFRQSESHCALTNSAVGVDTQLTLPCIGNVSWFAVLETARRKVYRLLGRINNDLVEKQCGVGPGASTSLSRDKSDAFYKFGHKPDVTPDCALYAWCLVYRQPAWFETLTGSKPSEDWEGDYSRFPPEKIFNLIPGNKVTTVPKNSRTDRVIAIEPDLNMYVQKGIGKIIRARLRRVGIDLNDQTVNQRLALAGSVSNDLATIDLSAASDTISVRLVEELLPPDWLAVLKLARSPVGVLPDGSVVAYSKFSSMGNGYTFELESMIFWALVSSVLELIGREGRVSVYGDDIIVPSDEDGLVEQSVTWCLSRAGFSLNAKKSFFRGPFRESCGKHYFLGHDVSPFYVRKSVKTVWDLYGTANRLKAWARFDCWGLDPRVKRTYEYVVERIPRPLRVLIPEGYGDVGLVADFDEARPVWVKRYQRLGCLALTPVVKRQHVEGNSLLTKWFHPKDRDTDLSVAELPRTIHAVGTLKTLLVRQWPSYGGWLTPN